MQNSDVKQSAIDFLEKSKNYIVMTDDAILINAKYTSIEKMIHTACQQPQMKATIISVVQKMFNNDRLAMFN